MKWPLPAAGRTAADLLPDLMRDQLPIRCCNQRQAQAAELVSGSDLDGAFSSRQTGEVHQCLVAFSHESSSVALQRRASNPMPISCWSPRALLWTVCEHVHMHVHAGFVQLVTDPERKEARRERRAPYPRTAGSLQHLALTSIHAAQG